MSDDKIYEIRREHFGVSDNEADDDEWSTPPLRSPFKHERCIINPSAPFTEEMGEQFVKALREAETHNAPVFYVDMKGTTLLDDEDMSYSEHVSEALAAHRRLEEPACEVGADKASSEDRTVTTYASGIVETEDGERVNLADYHDEPEPAGPTDEELRQQRMQLVDGWPGDWQWADSEIGEWRLVVADSYTTVTASIFEYNWPGYGDWAGAIEVRQPVQPHAHCILESQVYGGMPYDVARKLRPHGEALAACLEGMRDE